MYVSLWTCVLTCVIFALRKICMAEYGNSHMNLSKKKKCPCWNGALGIYFNRK